MNTETRYNPDYGTSRDAQYDRCENEFRCTNDEMNAFLCLPNTIAGDISKSIVDDKLNSEMSSILISSKVTAKATNKSLSNAFQNFFISADIRVNAAPISNNLEIFIDILVRDCKIELLNSNELGYLLDSFEIWIVPIKNESMPSNHLYMMKSGPNPGHFDIATWKLNIDGCCGKSGLGWKYKYIRNSLKKDVDHRRNFAPGKHSCHWVALKAMKGFRIEFKQVLCKVTNQYHWSKKAKVVHTLEISFNSFENFNENFESLRKSDVLHDNLEVPFPKNFIKTSEHRNIKIERSLNKY